MVDPQEADYSISNSNLEATLSSNAVQRIQSSQLGRSTGSYLANDLNSFDSISSPYYNRFSTYNSGYNSQYYQPQSRFLPNGPHGSDSKKLCGDHDFRTNIWGVLNGANAILQVLYSSAGILAQGGNFLRSTFQIIKTFAGFSSTLLGRITGIFYLRKLMRGLMGLEANWATELTNGGGVDSKALGIKSIFSGKSLKLLRFVALFGFVLSMFFKSKEEKKYKAHQQAWREKEHQIILQKEAEEFKNNENVEEVQCGEEIEEELENNFNAELKEEAKQNDEIVEVKALNESINTVEENSISTSFSMIKFDKLCEISPTKDVVVANPDIQDDNAQSLKLSSTLGTENQKDDKSETSEVIIEEKLSFEQPATLTETTSAISELVVGTENMSEQLKREEPAPEFQPSPRRPIIHVPVIPHWLNKTTGGSDNESTPFELPSMLKTVSSANQAKEGKNLPWLKKSQSKISP